MKSNIKAIMKKAVIFALVFVMAITFDAADVFAASKKPKKIYVTPTKKTLTVGKKVKIKVKAVKPKKASKSVKYKSSNKKIATVSSKGVVTAKKAGKATITVTSKKNKKAKAKVKITVKAKQKKPTPKPTPTPTPTPTKPKKAIVIYFARGENIEDAEEVYNKLASGNPESGYVNEGQTPIDAMTSASVLKDSTGKITGNNGLLAEWIAGALNTKTYSIRTKILYPKTKKETQTIVQDQEMAMGIDPDVEKCTEDLSQYDVVYLGFPNWHGQPPRALYTFMKENNLDGKTIVPFSSCDQIKAGGYGFGDAINVLKSKLPNSVVMDGEDGLLLTRKMVPDAKEEVEEWIAEVSKKVETVKADPLKTVAGQKEAATKLLGQTLSKEEIAEKVGKYNNMTVDVNGCTHGVSSVRFFYNGFTIYCRAAKDANDNVIQNQYTLISID